MAEQLIELVYDTKKTDRLVKGGIRYTDQLFNKIEKQLMELYKQCGSYEEFLEKAHGFVADNPLTLQGYDTYMTDLVKKAISDVRFSRPAQKVLTETVISNSVGELVKTNGEDLKEHIRKVTKRAYDEGIPPQKYHKELQAPPLIKGVDGAKRNLSSRARCKMIARTETKRALNTSNYIIGKERGATHWYALGFTDEHTCKNCISVYGTPSDPKYYPIDDVEYLPPLHPNCRHTAVYVKRGTGDTGEPETPDTGEELPIPTPAQLKKNLKPAEREKYNQYQRNIVLQRDWLRENPNASADEISKHRKRLAFLEGKFNELHRKALGLNGGTGKPAPKPKTPKETPKPKTPKKPKDKPKAEPKPKDTPKPKETEKTPIPTTKQLKEKLTPEEFKRYKRYIKEIKENKMSPEFIEMRKREVENFRRKALGLEPLPDNETILSRNTTPREGHGGKQLSAKELKSKLNTKQYNQFQKYSEDILSAYDKLNRFEKDDPRRIPLEQKIKRRMGMLDELEDLAINPPKPKTESTKPSKSKSKTTRELETPFDESKHLTKEQLDKMDFKQLAEHHGAEYLGLEVYDYDGKKYHMIEQTCSNGETFTIYFEEGAVKSYTNGGYATPNEIIHEVFKVPEALRKETNEIWFKNTVKGISKNYSASKYDSLRKNEGGYNLSWQINHHNLENLDDPDHKIVINPNYFKDKGGNKRRWLPQTGDDPDEELGWKHAVYHEFVHSGDKTRENWKNKAKTEISFMEEYDEIEDAEPYFTSYAGRKRVESFAEHGGYIARMEANPSEQNRKILIHIPTEGYDGIKKINYEEYKQMYPKHYEFFMRKFKEGF